MPRQASPLGRLRTFLRRENRGSCAVLRSISRASSWPGRAAWAKPPSAPRWPAPRRWPGLSTLIVEVEGKSGLATLFGAAASRLRGGRAVAGRWARRARPTCGPAPSRPTTRCSSTSGPRHVADLASAWSSTGALDMVATAAPGHQGHPHPRQGQAARAGRHGRPDRARRPRRRPRHHLPAVGPRRCSTPCGSGRSTAQARDVLEMLTDPERCQVVLVTPARGDAGQRAGRDGLQPRGRGRGQPRPGRRQRPLPRDRRARRRPRAPPRPRRARSCDPGEAEALASRGRVPRRPHGAAGEQVERLAEQLPLPQICAAVSCSRRPRPGRGRRARRPTARRHRGCAAQENGRR